MNPFVKTVDDFISIYVALIWIYIFLRWFVYFGAIDLNNRFVEPVYRFLHMIAEPLLRPIRRLIHPNGPIRGDFSPVILGLVITAFRGISTDILESL